VMIQSQKNPSVTVASTWPRKAPPRGCIQVAMATIQDNHHDVIGDGASMPVVGSP